MVDGLRVAVLGVTGAVGGEFLGLFERRGFPVGEIVPMASARSAGRTVRALGREWTVREPSPEDFSGVDVAFFSAGAARSREWAAVAVDAGALVVDNSSAFRMDPSVPLVVPEINMEAWGIGQRLIANPNCSAIILSMALAPLARLGRIERVIVSTYQSASGGGAAMMEDLLDQTRETLAGRSPRPRTTPHPYAFNLFSHNSPVGPDGLNEEEAKVVAECRKILGRPDLKVNPTCVRVPVLRAHSEAVTVEFAGRAPNVEAAREALRAFPGVRLVDDRAANRFPMPIEASGIDDVLVGRLRPDPSEPRALCLFVAGDQLLKGAALNAVQIAERAVATLAQAR